MSGELKTAAIVGGIGLLALLVWRGREAAGAVVDAINPASQTNIVNRGVNAALQAATGNPSATVGTRIYSLVHGSQSGPLTDEFRAVSGVPVHRSAGFSGVVWRAYSFDTGRWSNAKAPAAAAWSAAPKLMPGFVQLRAAGRPWHY